MTPEGMARVALVTSIVAVIISLGTVVMVQQVTCQVVRSHIQLYRETPPSTATGRDAQLMWQRLKDHFYC